MAKPLHLNSNLFFKKGRPGKAFPISGETGVCLKKRNSMDDLLFEPSSDYRMAPRMLTHRSGDSSIQAIVPKSVLGMFFVDSAL